MSTNPCEEVLEDFFDRQVIYAVDPVAEAEPDDLYQSIVAAQARLAVLKREREQSMKDYVAKMIEDIMRSGLPKTGPVYGPVHPRVKYFHHFMYYSPPKPPAKDYLKIVSPA